MTAPEVELPIVTDCVPMYVPAGGLKVGVAVVWEGVIETLTGLEVEVR